jgi:hypothetical protein
MSGFFAIEAKDMDEACAVRSTALIALPPEHSMSTFSAGRQRLRSLSLTRIRQGTMRLLMGH